MVSGLSKPSSSLTAGPGVALGALFYFVFVGLFGLGGGRRLFVCLLFLRPGFTV